MKRLIFLVMVCCCLSIQARAATPEELGISSAKTWLSLIDADKIESAWESSGLALKKAGPKGKVVAQLRGVRKKAGKFVSRTIINKQLVHDLPGAPHGDYVVIQYKTKFATKGDSVETVAASKEKDGKWRVSGYFVK